MSKLTARAVSSWGEPVAHTRQGALRGVEKGGTFIFRAVPYARAERFCPPKPPAPWTGLRSANCYACACAELVTPIPPDQCVNPHFFLPQSEDCLRLNIWTRSLCREARRPVIVWLHEDWAHGSATELFAADGENLCKFGDVVVVSVSHRLSCLAALDLTDFGPRYARSGTLALRDMVAALGWIRENIEGFGGDANRVTLLGGEKVLALLQTPAADGLYSRASVLGARVRGRSQAEYARRRALARGLGARVVERLGLNRGAIGEIARLPYWFLADAVLDAVDEAEQRTGEAYDWAPVAGGAYYPGLPETGELRREALRIPLLMGGTLGEERSNLFAGRNGEKNAWDEREIRARAAAIRPGGGDELLRAFLRAYPGHGGADAPFVDVERRAALREFMRRHAARGASVWNYLFALESPFLGGLVAWHGAEIPHVFCNAAFLEAAYIPEVTPRLQREMASAWLAFAESGEAPWPRVDPERVTTMIFDREARLGVDHDRALMDALAHSSKLPFSSKGAKQ